MTKITDENDMSSLWEDLERLTSMYNNLLLAKRGVLSDAR